MSLHQRSSSHYPVPTIPHSPPYNNYSSPTYGSSNYSSSNAIPTPWWKETHVWYALGGMCIVIVMIVLSKWSNANETNAVNVPAKVKKLIDQAKQYNQLAHQDSKLILKLIHCDYALCLAETARNLVSDQEIEKITGMNIQEIITYLQNCQSSCIRRINQEAPNMRFDGVLNVSAGWN